MIAGMGSRGASWLGRGVASAIFCAGYVTVALLMTGRSPIAVFVLIVAGSLAALAIHELGHLTCAIAVRSRVRELSIGAPPTLVSFHLGRTRVNLGLRSHGRVLHDATSVSRQMAITLAGPLSNLATGGVALAIPLVRQDAYAVAVVFGSCGVANLVPYRLRKGSLSDGARLLLILAQRRKTGPKADLDNLLSTLNLRARPDAAGRLLAAYRLGVTGSRSRAPELAALLRRDGRTAELLEVHRSLGTPGQMEFDPQAVTARIILGVEWIVLMVPGLPADTTNLAAERLDWVLKNSADYRPQALLTLAMARLRQGRFAEVEPLCAQVRADALAPAVQATVLATVAIARRACGQPYQDLVDEAAALSPAAAMVKEAANPTSG